MDLTTTLIITLVPTIASILAIVATVIGAFAKFKELVSGSEKETEMLKKQLKAVISENGELAKKSQEYKETCEAFFAKYQEERVKTEETLNNLSSSKEITSQNQLLINEVIKGQETTKQQLTALIKEVRNGETK